jgi:transcriptional regulator with XRE-family HTH domain
VLSATLVASLGQYKIGAKLRTLRHRKKLGLVQLSDHTGLSPAMLSKIERDQLVPTLPTLLRIALVFSVGLDHFFSDETRQLVSVVRRADRQRLPDSPGDETPAYIFESLDFPVTERKASSYYAEFTAKQSAPHEHPGTELVYVITGTLVLIIDGVENQLEPGDAANFDSGVTHSYRRQGDTACSAIVVVSPP